VTTFTVMTLESGQTATHESVLLILAHVRLIDLTDRLACMYALFAVGISGCASVRNAPLSPKSPIVFFHSSGCRPYFIFLSFYFVVYSI
jgi:hypothetical protein